MILVTGATGFVGTALVKRLAGREKVRCLVRNGSANLGRLEGLEVELAYGDIRDGHSVKEAAAGVDTIVHLAGINQGNEYNMRKTNTHGSKVVAQIGRINNMKRIIFLSHLGACFKPNMPIVFSKWLAEEELKHAHVPYTVLRSAVIFGSQDRFVELMATMMQHLSFFPIIGDGKSVVQPIWVEDVVSAILNCLGRSEMEYKTLSLAGPDQFFFGDLVDIIMNSLGVTRRKVHLPSALIMPIGDLLSRLIPKFPVSFQELALLQMDTRADLDTVEKSFDFKPRDFRKEIPEILSGRSEVTLSAILSEKVRREEERKSASKTAWNEDIDF